ncbi:hypothetical protein D0C36_10640 [Mucilaginibacter conchicola]|uniref:Uncharacterized protein n=1 Tax=Mucilaginibacter conchicola TaxID=2303333 RepID=A0A372NRM1_9SPHI|nr:hypothetical protein [Mucilaginibacter conchicola]RFZ91898.1 hypothetical protein D0C36_10640 [Mucilaginibacter conchicola]
MRVENPQAYRFIMQDDIYLLQQDKLSVAPETVADITTPEPVQPVAAENPVQSAPQVMAQKTEPVAPIIAQPVQETPKPAFNYMGDNQKQFLILVNYANEEYMNAGHRAALESILGRKELSIADVAILNVNKLTPIKLATLVAFFDPTRLVIMGKDALPEGIGNLPLNKPVQGKKIHVLYSFSFDDMMSSNDNKKAFWEQMKTL